LKLIQQRSGGHELVASVEKRVDKSTDGGPANSAFIAQPGAFSSIPLLVEHRIHFLDNHLMAACRQDCSEALALDSPGSWPVTVADKVITLYNIFDGYIIPCKVLTCQIVLVG